MAQYPKTESVGNIGPTQGTLYCRYSLIVEYWAIIMGTLQFQVGQPLVLFDLFKGKRTDPDPKKSFNGPKKDKPDLDLP